MDRSRNWRPLFCPPAEHGKIVKTQRTRVEIITSALVDTETAVRGDF